MEAKEYCTNLGLQLPMPASAAENDEAGFQNEPKNAASFMIDF